MRLVSLRKVRKLHVTVQCGHHFQFREVGVCGINPNHCFNYCNSRAPSGCSRCCVLLEGGYSYLEKSYGRTKKTRRQLTQKEEAMLIVALFASEGVVASAVRLSAKTSRVRSQLLAILSHASFARAEVGRSCVPWLQNLTQWLSWPLDNCTDAFKINSEARSRGIVCEQELGDHA